MLGPSGGRRFIPTSTLGLWGAPVGTDAARAVAATWANLARRVGASFRSAIHVRRIGGIAPVGNQRVHASLSAIIDVYSVGAKYLSIGPKLAANRSLHELEERQHIAILGCVMREDEVASLGLIVAGEAAFH